MLTALFPPSIGGIQSHTLRLSQKLVERGVEVHVVTRSGPGLPAFERMLGVRVHRVGVSEATGAAGSLAFMAEALRAVVRLRGHFDLLHAHQLLSPTTVGLFAAAVTGLPLIVNPHACGEIGDVGILSATWLGRLRLAAVMRGADAFVAVSRAICDELIGAGAPPQAVWNIVNGVDTDRFSPAAPRERRALRRSLVLGEEPLVAYTGRLAREKGVDVLVSAWPHLLARVPDARLCLLGEGPEEARLRQQARALGVEASVEFLGGVPDVAPHLRAADAAVLPSRTEGMPVALLEAMSCELPVVATAVGGSLEVLRDGATGWLVPPEAPAALGAALAEALLDPGAAARGAAARAHVLAHFAMDLVADRFLTLYRTLATRRAAAPGAGTGTR
jgi:glycosyltransferase involved in cell wall biosynthesis